MTHQPGGVRNTISFTVPGEPRGKGRPRATVRGGHARMYTDDKTASYENLVALAATAAMAGRPPLQGPLTVVIAVRLTPPKAASKLARAAMLGGSAPVYGRFDLDNICKAVLDGSNAIAFADDRQIVGLMAAKAGAETPGVDVEIQEWQARP